MNEGSNALLAPKCKDFRAQARSLLVRSTDHLGDLVAFANHDLDFVPTDMLDQILARHYGPEPPSLGHKLAGRHTRLFNRYPADAGIRVAALRRGLHVLTYEAEYGQYRQELLDMESPLHRFRPQVVLFALDAYHLAQGLRPGLNDRRLQSR